MTGIDGCELNLRLWLRAAESPVLLSYLGHQSRETNRLAGYPDMRVRSSFFSNQNKAPPMCYFDLRSQDYPFVLNW